MITRTAETAMKIIVANEVNDANIPENTFPRFEKLIRASDLKKALSPIKLGRK